MFNLCQEFSNLVKIPRVGGRNGRNRMEKGEREIAER